MNEIALDTLITQAENAGVFFITESDFDAIEMAAQENDAHFCKIDLAQCHTKAQLLDAVASGLHFPPSFGKNWDALADCLNDLSWLTSEIFVIYFSNADRYRDAHEEDFKTLIEILEETSTHWSEQNSPFWAFLSVSDEEFEAIQLDKTV
jgi:RNAse (barnase) inhibitor barstar